jgi:hypothetical protein
MQIADKIIFTGMRKPISDHLVDNDRIDQRAIAGDLDHCSGAIMQCSLIMPVQQITRVAAITIQTLLAAYLNDNIILRQNSGSDDDPPTKPGGFYPLRLPDE